ncbi:MAG: preprotein translocase subunit SecE [Chloroflexi bacterium]|nr:preprotein translocase subunit SecE [Chloroflexota bacterium]MBI5053857.1 preprotein translocase subunit SecE [Chloroflexota bacterium]MBI5348766.1 preprotein translocase subunit SecE [Chloroflexota bacterium]
MNDNPIVGPIIRYARETRAELSKVSWPSRQDATNLTVVVLVTVVVSSLVLGSFDALFSQVFVMLLGVK